MTAKAQQGFSLSAKVTPQLSFLQNEDDNNSSALETKSTFNANFGVGSGYTFTNRLGVGMDVLYSLRGQPVNYLTVQASKRMQQPQLHQNGPGHSLRLAQFGA